MFSPEAILLVQEIRSQTFRGHYHVSLRGQWSITLGARDFSSAVSRFFSRLRRSWLRPTAEDVSAFGQHQKFPPHARKTSGTQGNDLFNRKLGIVNWGFVLTIPHSFCARSKTILDRASVHTQERWFRRDFCNGAKLCSADLESGASHVGQSRCQTLVP